MLQKIRTRFGKVNVYAAGDPDGQRVLVVPGYSETIAHNRKLVDELGSLGMFAATMNQPRKSSLRRLGHPKRDPLERQTDVLVTMLDRLAPGVKITAVGHSMGAAAVLKAAQERPDRFESIILEQPAGFGHPQGLPEQMRRVSHKVVHNQLRSLFGQGRAQSAHGYTASPDKESGFAYGTRVGVAQNAASLLLARNGALAVQEARASGKYDGVPDLENVTKLGIPVHVVGAHRDEMFDHADLDSAIMPEGEEFRAPLSYVADQRAGHDTAWMQPKLHAELIGSLVNPWIARPLH